MIIVHKFVLAAFIERDFTQSLYGLENITRACIQKVLSTKWINFG